MTLRTTFGSTRPDDVTALEEIVRQLALPRRPETGRTSAYEMAKLARTTRRRRDALFAGHGAVFGEPGWDLMIELFVAQAEGRRMSVDSACDACRVTRSTALRWVASLLRAGLIQGLPEQDDADPEMLKLSPLGLDLMSRSF